MQQTIASTHFPTKLQRLTHKVNKLLTQKYHLQGNAQNIGDNHLANQIKLSSQDIQIAVEKSQNMTTKLKLLRTLLGYQCGSSKKQKKLTKIVPEQKQTEEKGVNLKQFVMSMRKKNELTDKYFKHRKSNTNNSPQKTFDEQSKSIQQYTDASLKYVHSFLPHQTTLSTLEQLPIRRKRSVQYISQPYNNMKGDEPFQQDHFYETIQDQNYDNNHNHYRSSLYKQQSYQTIVKSKKSLNASVYASNSPKYVPISEHISMNKQQGEKGQRFTQIYKKQQINLPLVQNQQKNQRQKQSKLANITLPFNICANRVTELVYKGKHYSKQLKNSIKSQMSTEKTLHSKQRQQKKNHNQLLPIIKQCMPKKRSTHGNVGTS